MGSLSWASVLGHSVSMFLYGLHVSIFLWFSIMVRRKRQIKGLLRYGAILGLVLSTICVGIQLYAVGDDLGPRKEYHFAAKFARLVIEWTLLLQTALTNTIQLWRTYLILGRSKPVCAPLALLLVTAIGFGVTYGIMDSLRFQPSRTIFPQKHVFEPPETLFIAAAFLSIVMNIAATTLVAARLISHNREARRLTSNPVVRHANDGQDRYFNHLVVVIIESGVVYTLVMVLWVVFAIFNTLLNGLHEAPAFLTYFGTMVVGLYPLTVVLLAEIGKPPAGSYPENSEASVRFAAPTDLENGASSSSSPVMNLRRTSETYLDRGHRFETDANFSRSSQSFQEELKSVVVVTPSTSSHQNGEDSISPKGLHPATRWI